MKCKGGRYDLYLEELDNLIVHHIDGRRENNSIDNLELLTRSEHIARYHNDGGKGGGLHA